MRTRKDRELIIWDGNRLSMPTQRQFHAAVQEIRGQRLMTVPGAALEMLPLMRPEEPDRGRQSIIDEIGRRTTQGRGRRGADNILNAEAQLWWLDEWSRPDGIYGLRELNEEEVKRYEVLMEHVPVEGFSGATDREALRGLPDAQIVCETLAIDGMLLLTHDPKTIKPEKILPWTQTLAEAGWISHPKVVEEADRVNVRWVEQTPTDMLLGTIVCAWPQETDAPPSRMPDRIDDLVARLALAGLEETSKKLKELISRTNDLPKLIERTHSVLPVQMRNAERRSPYTSWTGREERPRGPAFRLTWTGENIALVHRSLNGNDHEWGAWTRDDFPEMETFFARRNITVEGLPAPKDGGGGGFVAAMQRTVAELERQHGIGC